MDTVKSKTIASLMTARAVAAIGSIQLIGSDAKKILSKIFKPTTKNQPDYTAGKILYGDIVDCDKIIDTVVVGCEGENDFSINAHGSPLIVEKILKLLKKSGADIVTPTEIYARIGKSRHRTDSIAIEAQIAISTAATLKGARIIARQTKDGLSKTAKDWLSNIGTLDVEQLKTEAKKILADSKLADCFMKKPKIVLSGAPNSGKSTLFNWLCGKEKAIVTDIAGTTRDWLAADIKLKNITAQFFDTAGVDEKLSQKNIIDAQSQRAAVELIKNCDLLVQIVDAANGGKTKISLPTDKARITVFNKSDLVKGVCFDGPMISAKTGAGIEGLVEKIEEKLGACRFDMKNPVCFTQRQRVILEQIIAAEDKPQVSKMITELLNGNTDRH